MKPDVHRLFMVDAQIDDSLGASRFVVAADQAQRYRLYADIETDSFDYGVVAVSGMPGISVAFATLNYLLEGRLQGLWINGIELPLDKGLADRWEESRLDEVLRAGSLVQTESPREPVSLSQIVAVLNLV